MQVPPVPFAAPMQTPPVWQVLATPSQQAPPTAPQAMQLRAPPPIGVGQASPVLQVLPAQHASPLAPQAAHMLAPPPAGAAHTRPVSQELAAPALPQQIAPEVPQLTHIPVVASHRVAEAVQVVGVPPALGQQAWAEPPHAVPPAV
jgi:hypothetical protein